MKKFLIGLVLFIAAVIFALNATGKYLLAKALEQSVGAPVEVGNIRFSPFSSRIGVYGLRIENPPGFRERTLAYIPEIFISYSARELVLNRVHLHEVRVNLDQVTVEKNEKGVINVTQIGVVKGAGAKREPAPAPGQQKAPEPAPAKKLEVLIDRADLSLGRARYVDYSQGQPVIREFPLDIRNAVFNHLTDPQQVMQQIVLKTMQRVGLNAISPDLGQLAASFETQASTAAEQVKGVFNEWSQKFKAKPAAEPAAAQ